MLNLEVLPGSYAICRLDCIEAVPEWVQGVAPGADAFVSITRTSDELSIVCLDADIPDHVKAERDWRCMRVAGKLDFALVGVIAKLTKHLADATVSVFVVSTFDTDYLLVKEDDWARAVTALSNGGYSVPTDGGQPGSIGV
ncbi:MAG: ACT domain-containing protein [Rubripirellula sp.]|nr:ACT domain-containing protein [Rubripirellula sp.]